MIFQQAFHRALDNVSDSDVERFGCLAKHVAIVVSHRTNEAYRQLLVAFIVLDVAHKERLERIEHQAVYCRLLDVLNQERRQRSEEAVGCRLFIHFWIIAIRSRLYSLRNFSHNALGNWFLSTSPTSSLPSTAPLPSSPRI